MMTQPSSATQLSDGRRLSSVNVARRCASRLKKRTRADFNRAVVRTRAACGYAPEDLIFLVGEPRSGTTWLAEAVADALMAPLVFEPDNSRHEPDRPRRPRYDFDPQTAALYQQVMTGRRLPADSARKAWRGLRSGQLVVKSVSAVPYLAALVNQFPAVPKTLIVRHPCAVIASQMRAGFFNPGEVDEIVPPAVLERHGHLEHPMSLANNVTGRQALRWAMNHWSMTRSAKPAWHAVSYESLLDRDDDALRSVAAGAGCDPTAIEPLLNRKSSTVWGDATVSTIDSWRRRLEPNEIRLILEIVHAVGIDWYDDGPRPVQPIPGRALTR